MPRAACQIELTNQDGEAMAIPAEDSAALMEGMMLHRQGLACVARVRAGARAAAASTATVAGGKEGALNAQAKKALHPSLPPPKGKTLSPGETPETTPTPTPATTTATTTATPTAATATTNSGSLGTNSESSLEDDGANEKVLGCSDGGGSGRGSRIQSAPEEKGEERIAEEGGDAQVEIIGKDLGTASEGGAEGGGGIAAMSDTRNARVGTAEGDAAVASGRRWASKGVLKDAAKSVAKGKGRPKPGERARGRFSLFCSEKSIRGLQGGWPEVAGC